MSLTSSRAGRRTHARRSLRLLNGGRELSAPRDPADGLAATVADQGEIEERSRILLVGEDPDRRASLRRELTSTLPPTTLFEEAGEVWEVLEHAPSSGVVMLTGDLPDVSAESLMHLLGDRYPKLPVVALDTRADTLAAAV
jgi:CheY-like chemotaxis protein